MKILFTSHKSYPDIGGIESVTTMLTEAFVKAGHSLRLVTNSPGNKDYDKQNFPFAIIRQPSLSEYLRCYYWADLVFQNNLEVRRLWPQLFLRKKLVIALHTWIHSPENSNIFISRLKRRSLGLASSVVSCSNAIRMNCAPKSLIIHNPYRDDLFHTTNKVRRKNSIVFLGRLVSDKGVDLLLRAYKSTNQLDWPLTIIGSGPEQTALEQLAISLGIQSSVNFLGSLHGEKLVSVLNEHELMVVPSLWQEPFGLVVLEGMACGCVILASDGGGLPEATGTAGLLFKRGNQLDLSLKLSSLIQNPKLRSSLRIESVSHLLKFSQKIACSHYLQLIESFIAVQ